MSRRLLAHGLLYAGVLACSSACTGEKDDDDDAPPIDPFDVDGDGFTEDEGDCDDKDLTVNPEADELCDGRDQDCDDEIDEHPVDAPTWYRDADGDTYGTSTIQARICERPAGYVDDGTDCDDASAAANPGETEVCDDADNDCDGEIDIGAVDVVTWYEDLDADGVGNDTVVAIDCDAPEGAVADPTDCDDTNPHVYPGAPELCDGAFNDCTTSGEWSEASEDGQASVLDRTTSLWTDITSTVAGSSKATVAYAPTGTTTTYFCRGTFYVRTEIAYADTWLLGRHGAEPTILNGLGEGAVIVNLGTGVQLEGLTVTNGADTNGGGLSNTGVATVTSCAFTGNRATMGGGIYSSGPLTVNGSTFERNASAGLGASGGGLYASNVLTVSDSTFATNVSEGYGGGLAGTTAVSAMTVERSTFTDNVAPYGAAIASSTVRSFQLVDSVVTGNSGTSGGGLYLSDGTTVQVSGSTIARNTAVEGGGAYLDRAALESATTDWGSGADENLPHDIFATGPSAGYSGTSDTFTCTGTDGC